MAEPIRLQKYLSQTGAASRRKGEELILAGRVRVNGQVVRELGTKVDPDRDRVELDGIRLRGSTRRVWLVLHKPAGYVTTRSDPEGRRTVYDLLPQTYHSLFYIGRLDVNSEGLVLLTNDGEAANRLAHPRYQVDRVYRADVRGAVTDDTIRRLLQGVKLEDGMAKAAAVKRMPTNSASQTRLRVTLREGRNREVRRLMEAVGHPVVRLVRVSYGPVTLKGLSAGEFRKLTREERSDLEKLIGSSGT